MAGAVTEWVEDVVCGRDRSWEDMSGVDVWERARCVRKRQDPTGTPWSEPRGHKQAGKGPMTRIQEYESNAAGKRQVWQRYQEL